MATEQNCTRTALQNHKSLKDNIEKWEPTSAATEFNSSSCFDCSICLDSVQDPVVTFCGHLYCWPCIYEWIRQQSNSPELPENQQPQCPICKSEVSERTLIPLYGRGQSVTGSNKNGPVIPSRPKGPSCATLATMAGQLPSQLGVHRYTSAPAINLAGSTPLHPVISMFGDLICARVLGNQQALDSYSHSYSVANARNSRSRRRVMQADRSLSRLSFFFCCCVVMCLVLF